MKKNDIIVLLFLAILTISTALISGQSDSLKYAAFLIMILSSIKFLLVAFQFMELKKAHGFWKGLLIGYLVVFVVAVLIILG